MGGRSSKKASPSSPPPTPKPSAIPMPPPPVRVLTTIQSASGLVNSISSTQPSVPVPSYVPVAKSSTESKPDFVQFTSPTQDTFISPPSSSPIVPANRVVVFDVNSYIIPDHEIEPSSYRKTILPRKYQTDKFSLRVCFKYNGKRGCKLLNYCYRFHVCQLWVKGECKKDQCPSFHNFNNVENSYLFHELSSRHFGEDELKERLKTNMYHRNGIKESMSESICMDYVLNRCVRENCPSYHIKGTYSWEVKLNNKWLKLPWDQNEEIEKTFCDPTNDVVTLGSVTRMKKPGDFHFIAYLAFPNEECKIDFNSMTLITSKGTECSIRRLSTPSDVAFFKSVATRWLWYYETEDNEWRFYDNAYVDERLVIPFSDYIETMYLKKERDLKYYLSHYYDPHRNINFETMMDSKYYEDGLGRRIKRRPYPIDANRWRENTTFRSLWSKEENSTIRRKVEPTSPEFHFVKKLLTTSISIRQIHIERIENRHMWNAYQLKRSLMMQTYRNDLSKVNEQYLFHGTSEKVSEKIPTGNLEWRLYGTHVGNIYGKGAYFANSAQISDRYSSVDHDGYKYMFVAMVLIGTAAVGNKEMSIPPVNPSTQYRFDSTVDRVDPKIFVKYNLDEYYPAYMVKYKVY